MSRVVDVALFLCGAYLAMRTIAAAYRALDLWYAIRVEYPRVIRGILGWGGASVAVAALAGSHRSAFSWGLLAFAAFYLSLYALRRLALRRTASRD